MPLFSIVIPTFNRENELTVLLSSIAGQNEGDFEAIIVDDGGTDNTREVVEKLSDHRFKYYWKKNEERSVARNFGFLKCTGEYVNFFDSDDVMYQDHLSNAKAVIENENNPPVINVGYEIKDPNERIVKRVTETKNFRRRLAYENFLSCNSVFVRQDVAKEFPFDENPEILTSEDYALWINISLHYEFRSSSKVTFCMSEHSDRSLNKLDPYQIERKYLYLIENLRQRSQDKSTRVPYWSYFKASKFSFISLSFLNTSKKKSASYLLRSFLTYPPIIFTRRFLAISRDMLFI